MTTRRQWVMALMAVGLAIGWAGAGVAAPPPGLLQCQAHLATCTTKLATCTDALAAAPKFPATGQTTCWNSSGDSVTCAGTGQDGDIQAGATLSYTDKGDGTITDNNTGLMWEKKSDDDSIHDKDTTYTWADALETFIPLLNNRCANNETVDCTVNGDADCGGVGGVCGFAGHRDWRLPNVKELHSIVNYAGSIPPVSSEFNTGCGSTCTVTTCSCIATDFPNYIYWSSSSYLTPSLAWFVGFNSGDVSIGDKSNFTFSVRAVRGGL